MVLRTWPIPTVEMPTMDQLRREVEEDSLCEATDGCYVEPDGVCEHGYPSWMLYLYLI